MLTASGIVKMKSRPFRTLVCWWMMLVGQLATCHGQVANFEGWQDLEISSKVAAAMPYQDFKLDIYQLQRNQSRGDNRITYAFTPVVQLDHETAVSRYNPVTETHEVVFRVNFWTDDIQHAVVDYLRNELQLAHVKASDVTPIRFNKVMLTTSHPSRLYTLSSRWENYRQEKSLDLKLLCSSAADCDLLAELMRRSADLFSDLRVAFTVSSKALRTRSVTITAESVTSGKLFSRLRQRFPKTDCALLTAEDTNQLISDSATNVVALIFDDTGTVNPNSAIYNQLRNVLINGTVATDEMDPSLWTTVFWNEDNYRPDKTSRIITDVYLKSDAASQKRMAELFRAESETEQITNVDLLFSQLSATKFSLKRGFRHTETEHAETEREEFVKTMRQARSYVEWKGDKFQPKPMLLSRINLADISKKNQFSDVSSLVTYATVGLEMNLKIDKTFRLTDELIFQARDLLTSTGTPGPQGPAGAPGQPGKPGVPGLPGQDRPSVVPAEALKKIQVIDSRLSEAQYRVAGINATISELQTSRKQLINAKVICALNNVVCRDTTTNADAENGNVASLRKHNVLCSKGEYLSRFQYVQATPSKIRYDFKCCRLRAC